MVYYNHTAKIGGDLFLDWSRGWRGSTLYGHQKPASLISSRSRESMISMDGPGALRNNGHPSRGQNGRLNGAQTGGWDTAQCSGPFPFPLTFRRGGGGGGGGATPMRRLLSPGVSERCSSAASGQRLARRPLCGQWARLEKHTHARTHTGAFTLRAPLHALEVLGPLSKKFRHEQLRGIRE